ncbi:hypothetical protein JCM9279_000055 [Rhodotorula babjevae]
MLEGWTVLHSLSWLALAAGFLFLLLSLASGLLYVAEVIEEHSGLAKTVGKRLVYVEVLLFVLLFAVDGLPWHLVAVGILAHLVYLQNFSRTWPTISLTSPTFIASCILVLASHFLSFRHFSARSDAAAHHGRYTHYNAYDSRRSRYGAGHGGAGGRAGGPESFLDVATYFGVCVWLVPFYLFLSLSANDNVLPSAGESRRSSPTPGSPSISVSKPTPASSPALGRHQRQRSSMVKTALSSAFSLIPSALRPATLSAQLPMSDKSVPRHDIPRSPSPTFEFDHRGGGGGGRGEGSSSGFSAGAGGAGQAQGVKPRPQPLLRTSTSTIDMRRPSATASHPTSPIDGPMGLGVSPVSSYFPSSAPLPSPSSSLPQQQRRFFPQQQPGTGSQPSSPAGSRFPSLSASLGPPPSSPHAPSSPVSSTSSARFPLSASLGPSSSSAAPSAQQHRSPFPPPPPGMVRRNTTDRPSAAVSALSSAPGPSAGGVSASSSAFAQVGALGGGEGGRRSSEAVIRPGSGGGGGPVPQIRRRGTVDGYGLG